MRYFYQLLGVICVALGIIGALLPVMPTTVFLLIALWAFGKSSPRCHQWLLNHPRFGKTLLAWEQHRAMSLRAKKCAISSLFISFAITAMLLKSTDLIVLVGVILLLISIYILHIPTFTPHMLLSPIPSQKYLK